MISLPLPCLEEQERDSVRVITDNALAYETGVRVVFSGRQGGASQGPYASLNLGDHVDDDLDAVLRNRERLLRAVGAQDYPLLVPRQVHGTNLVHASSSSEEDLSVVRSAAQEGADGVLVSASQVAALLCFADCVPVVVVSPTGRFAVVHAGWRGVEAGIVPLAVRQLARFDVADGFACDEACVIAEMNVYVGPHIQRECFETGDDVRRRFAERFGDVCLAGDRCIDLAAALELDLARAGVSLQRVCHAGICTRCESEKFFSYRASGGVCGRHGALAFRSEAGAAWA
ncbi:MAG: laccase domain-containing protein [Eggerthellaceae bacterium]|nr:laccase domain-containing protein [Eggerthellaceae bacterium]